MKGTQKDADDLLKKSFLTGMAGILCAIVPLVIKALIMPSIAYESLFTGAGIGLQLWGLSLAVLVLRQRRLSVEQKEKARKMTLVLTVALIFFILA
jgi:hypothetical protein